MFLSNWFKRKKTVKIDEAQHAATQTLRERTEQVMADYDNRKVTRHSRIPTTVYNYYH